VEVGQSKDLTFTVTNSGGGTLTGSGSINSGGGTLIGSGIIVQAPFSITSGGQFNLGAGQSQTVTVRFSPTREDFFSAFATVTSNAGDTQVTLSGEGVSPPPQCSVTPTLLDFGQVTSGTKDLSFTVTNSGGGTLSGSASVTSGSEFFQIVSGTPFSLDSGQSQSIVVRLSLSTIELIVSGSIEVFLDDESSCATVSLSGVGPPCAPGGDLCIVK
jgi:hypothetical protein